jgi:hypothetical protein
MGQENKSELSDILPELHDQEGNFSLQSAPALAPANNNQAAPAAPQSESDPVTRFGAGLAGAAAGKVFGAPVEKPVNPNLIPAQSDLAAKRAVLEAQQNTLASHQQNYAQELDRLRLEKAAADAALRDAGTTFQEATAHARSLNALPEPIQVAPSIEPEAPKLSSGAERHANKMKEIRQANKVERGLEGVKEFSHLGGNDPSFVRNSRLLVPAELANAPVHTPAQLEAIRRLEQSEAAHQKAIRDAAAAKLNLDRSKTPNTITKTQEAVTKAQAAQSGAAAKLAELEKAKPSVLQRVGYNLGKLPYFNILSGALSGAELAHAYDAYHKGLITEGTLALMAGVGGGISMFPHPAAKAIGFGMQLPEMGYQAYHAIKD